MAPEEMLRNYILSRYRSIREFTIMADIPYTTVKSVLERGIGNSSVSTVIKICKALRISADELADGKIVPASKRLTAYRENPREIQEYLEQFKMELSAMENLTLEGEPVDENTIEAIAQGIDVSYETVKRYNKNHNKIHNKN